VQEAHGQDREAISVRNIEENNIEKIKNLCSTSSSMKKVVNKKLEECNIDINNLRDIICKLNNKIVDMKAIISKILLQIREEKTENDKVIQLCNDKLKKISLLYSYISEMKESIDKKMDICDKNINETKNDFIVSLNDMSNLKNEVNEVKDEMEEVRKLMTKLIEDIKCQDKIQRIEWSISNIKSVVENFQFKICPLSVTAGKAPDKPMESHNLLKTILMAFRDGAGLYLPDAVKNEEYPTSAQEETKKKNSGIEYLLK
jgi:chromosome segregation ATPase